MREVLFRKEKEGVRCLACSWYCYLREGQTGVCGVRANVGGKGKLLVYGKVYGGLAVDPIEKKPFYHFLPGSKALSFGTMGCNFGCLFCQNWEMSQLIKSEGLSHLSSLGYLSKTPKEIVEAAVKNGCRSIAYTYNEPSVFVEFAYETMKLAKKAGSPRGEAAGLKNVFVSNGYESKESFDLIKDYLDGINIDLKGAPTSPAASLGASSEEFYRKYCRARIEPVLENIERFFKNKIWIEVTTMLIEGVNDSVKDLKWIASFLKNISPNIPWHLSAMHPDYKMKEGRVTPYSRLERAYKIGREAGLKYVYAYSTENTTKLDNTYCSKCGKLLIERSYFDCEIVNLKNGKCLKCGGKIEGIWR